MRIEPRQGLFADLVDRGGRRSFGREVESAGSSPSTRG